MGFDGNRVVEVFAKPTDGAGCVGSGYRVTSTSVLTAGHVVVGLPIGAAAANDGASRCDVRPLGIQEWMSGSVLWHDESTDVALIGLPDNAPPLPAGSPAPRWGVVAGAEPVSCTAVGFPWAQEQPDRVRETEQLRGFISPLTMAKAGHLSLDVLSTPPDARTDGSPWAGMSGAAVFAGPYLVGVVIVDPARFGEGRLVAAAISPLSTDPRFVALAGTAAAAPLPVQPRFRLAVTQDLSVLLRPPYQPLPGGLTFARAPVRLLLAEYGVVPFLGREQSAVELQAWCRGADPFGLRVVTGDGGAGKTRLAAELATRLMRDGWDAGFADKNSPGGATRLEPERPMLLIVNDADVNVELASGLVTTLANQVSAPPSRLLLVARHVGAWWQQLNTRTDYLAQDFAADALPLQAGQLSPDEQRHHYDAACAAFGAHLGRPVTQLPVAPDGTPPLPGDDFVNPLLVHMYALLMVLGEDAALTTKSAQAGSADSHREEMLKRILGRERRRWDSVPVELSDITKIQAITVASLVAPPSRAGLSGALEAIPSLAAATAVERERISEWLHNIYPGGGWVGPLRPDLVTEQLLAETPDLSELVLSVAERTPSADESAHLLGELTRAAPNRAIIHDALAALLRSRLAALLDLAIGNVTSPLPTVLDLAVRQAPQLRMAAELVDRLPQSSTALAVLAADITGQAVAASREELAAGQPAAPRLAASLTNRSVRLAHLGQREDALAAGGEALALYRELATAQPGEFLPRLALSLNNQSGRLADLGRREDALAAAGEAGAIYQELGMARPGEFLSDLAMSMNNQSNLLGDLGREEEALVVIMMAVAIRRELAAAQPDAFRPDLATSLNSQSVTLAHLGRPEEALAAIGEAVAIRRDLAAAQPDAFLPDLAMSLSNQSNRLAQLGRREEALAVIGEAVAIRRELVAARPDAFRPELAASLDNQSNRLTELERPEEALTANQEALGIYRELAAARPDAFRPDLSASLNNQAVHLGKLGRLEEALAVIGEAVAIRRGLAGAWPDAFRPRFAESLVNQSGLLGQLGRVDEALAAIGEAADTYRELAAAHPDKFLPGLAKSLNIQFAGLAQTGRGAEALAVIGESVAIYRKLAAARPATLRPDFAAALDNQAAWLAQLGRAQEALATAGEAVGVYRELAAGQPDEFRPGLARSLTMWGLLLYGQRRIDEAVPALAEALHAVENQREQPVAQAAVGILQDAYQHDPGRVTAAWQRATGTSLPNWLRGGHA